MADTRWRSDSSNSLIERVSGFSTSDTETVLDFVRRHRLTATIVLVHLTEVEDGVKTLEWNVTQEVVDVLRVSSKMCVLDDQFEIIRGMKDCGELSEQGYVESLKALAAWYLAPTAATPLDSFS